MTPHGRRRSFDKFCLTSKERIRFGVPIAMREAKIMQLDEDTSQMKRLVIARATPLPRRLDQPAAAA
jgi:hypothetical protein